MSAEHCERHSGLEARINSLEARGKEWDKMYKEIRAKIDTILVSIVASAVGIIGHLLYKIAGGV
jgi:hypothetical protein